MCGMQLAKIHKRPLTNSNTVYSHPLELLEVDLWGPAPISSNGYEYFLSIVDIYTRFTWIYFLVHKSDATLVFQQFHRIAEKQFNNVIKSVQTDGGGVCKPLSVYLSSQSILHCLTCPYTYEQNGIVERKHQHIIEIGLTLLAQASLPLRFWSNAFYSAVFLINRLPTKVLSDLSPSEKYFNKKPDYNLLKVFGCLCFTRIRLYNNPKLDFRSTPSTILEYCNLYDGYKRMDYHVIFHEEVFPFNAHQPPTNYINSHSFFHFPMDTSPRIQQSDLANISSSV